MSEIQALQGIDTVLYFRLLEDATKKPAMLLPLQTSLDWDMQRDTDTNATKDGAVTTYSPLELEVETEFIDNGSEAADKLYDALLNNKKVELWKVYRKRRNSAGQYFAMYARGIVSEDSASADADDNASRDVTFTGEGEPKRGWITLSKTAQEELDYIFRGIEAITDSPKNDGTDGNGKAWQPADAGTGTDAEPEE